MRRKALGHCLSILEMIANSGMIQTADLLSKFEPKKDQAEILLKILVDLHLVIQEGPPTFLKITKTGLNALKFFQISLPAKKV